MTYDFKKLEEKLAGAVSRFESEVAVLRTGRANPALVEDVKIEAYGVSQPLKNVAAITVGDAKTLLIQPWDRSLMEAIEKGVNSSNLGLRAAASKENVRVILPDLTQERRQSLLKLLKEKLEDTRVILRQARDEVWKDIQDKERSKAISEDEKFRFKDEMEKKVKLASEKLDQISAKREKDIME